MILVALIYKRPVDKIVNDLDKVSTVFKLIFSRQIICWSISRKHLEPSEWWLILSVLQFLKFRIFYLKTPLLKIRMKIIIFCDFRKIDKKYFLNIIQLANIIINSCKCFFYISTTSSFKRELKV